MLSKNVFGKGKGWTVLQTHAYAEALSIALSSLGGPPKLRKLPLKNSLSCR